MMYEGRRGHSSGREGLTSLCNKLNKKILLIISADIFMYRCFVFPSCLDLFGFKTLLTNYSFLSVQMDFEHVQVHIFKFFQPKRDSENL